MIIVDSLSYSFPHKELFHNISFTLEDGQHSALIGTSGSGKSTLIDIILHKERYLFDGRIEMPPHYRIGYVSQFIKQDVKKDITVYDYLAEEFLKLQNEITSLCTDMESGEDMEALFEGYQKALDEFDAIGGNDFESNINKKLNLANLGNKQELMLSQLSGGEFKLIQTIKEMLTGSDFMVMDEPDVFLDFDHLTALKDLINAYKGIMLVITHNRYLLNHCFNKMIHLENMELQEFDGRYVDYNFSLLQRKIELQELAVADAEEIKRNDQIVERLRTTASIFTDASRGKSLKARVKIKERLEARQIKAPFVEIRQPKIHLETDQGMKDEIILKVNDYQAAFDELLLKNVDFEMKETDKVALIGANGTGKTTLLRDIYMNNSDCIEISKDAKMAFLSQHPNEMLKESNTIEDEFFDAGFSTYQEIEEYLAGYGFEHSLKQKIGALSGGEKNLLQLAKIAASNTNLLLLDEPTSHMDTYSQLALEKAIEDYSGAILMISHDFYTVANCMDYVLMIEDKTIRKMSIRKFRKMIYANHFNKDYLEIEQKKKEVENKIALALKATDFELAKVLSKELEELIN